MSDLGKKRIFLIGLILLIGVLGIANNLINGKRALNTSTEYVQYEEDQMNLHEGEVLVDSNSLEKSPAIVTSKTQPSDSKDEDNKNPAPVDSSDSNYFETSRSTINMDRNQILSMLTEVIEENPDVKAKNQATEQKLKLIDYMNKEKVVENLLNNKGYKEVLVLITDNSVNVTVKASELNQSDIAKILDIVTRETGRSADQTIIQNKY